MINSIKVLKWTTESTEISVSLCDHYNLEETIAMRRRLELEFGYSRYDFTDQLAATPGEVFEHGQQLSSLLNAGYYLAPEGKFIDETDSSVRLDNVKDVDSIMCDYLIWELYLTLPRSSPYYLVTDDKTIIKALSIGTSALELLPELTGFDYRINQLTATFVFRDQEQIDNFDMLLSLTCGQVNKLWRTPKTTKEIMGLFPKEQLEMLLGKDFDINTLDVEFTRGLYFWQK